MNFGDSFKFSRIRHRHWRAKRLFLPHRRGCSVGTDSPLMNRLTYQRSTPFMWLCLVGEGRWTQPHKVPIVLKAEASAGVAFLLRSAAGSRSLTSSGLSTPYSDSSP